jgi:hypothetical protein
MMDLHKIFEKAQQEASKLENIYQTAFEKTGYALVLEPPKEKHEIKTSQQHVEVSHEWDFSDHRYMPDEINYDMSANLSELTPQQILQHFSHARETELGAGYRGLKIPLSDLKKYPVLDEAIELRRQKEGKKLEKLIELVKPVTDMRRHFNNKDLEQLKEKIVYKQPCIEIWSNSENSKNPQAVAEDLISERILIEKLKKEEEKAKTSMKALSGPSYATQRMIVNQRLDAIRKGLREHTPLGVERIRAYEKKLFGEENREVEIELERLYGNMKLKLSIFPPEPVVRVYKQEFRAKPNFNIPETEENAILAGPSGMGVHAYYGDSATITKGKVSLSWPIWVNVGEGKFKTEPSTTSVKADLRWADSKVIENILTDMEQLTNNISKK